MATLKMALNTAADAVICFNQYGGLVVVMSVFTLTLWVEGVAGMFSGLAWAWTYGFADALELERCFRIMRVRHRITAPQRFVERYFLDV